MPLGCLIGVPCWQSWDHRFSMCMNSCAPPMNFATSTLPVANKRIDIARNEIVEAALRNNAEFVFFLDSDVLFPPQSFQQLLLRHRNNPELKIISGVYWSKSNPSFPLIFHEAGRGSFMDWKMGDFLEDVGYAIGMGLVLIHTDVFRAIEPPWYKVDYGLHLDTETGASLAASLTEDLYFCEKAHAAGFKISVDTGIQAGHLAAPSHDTVGLYAHTYHTVFAETSDKDKAHQAAQKAIEGLDTGAVFGLNDGMPQAQSRAPSKSPVLFIGDVLAGGEPACVLSRDKNLKPTWLGGPERIPFGSYETIKAKDPDIAPGQIQEVYREWYDHLEPGGQLELMHPDFASLLSQGISNRHVYPVESVESALLSVGFTDIGHIQTPEWFVVKARKPKSDKPIVSIIIPAKDLHEMTFACIQSIRDHTAGEYEIILVDNASSMPYKKMGDKLVRADRPLPYGQAIELGAKLSQAPYLLLLNNDTLILEDNWLDNLLARIRGNGTIAAVGPKQITPMGTIYHAGIAFDDRIPFHINGGVAHDHQSVQTESFVLALNFGCVLLRRELLERYPFDPRYGDMGNYEDIDWCLTVRKEGMALVYTPSVTILHAGAQTQAQEPERSRKCIEKNLAAFLDKWKDAEGGLFGEEQ